MQVSVETSKTNLLSLFPENLGDLDVHHKLPDSDVADLLHLGDDGPPLYHQPTQEHKQQVSNDITNSFRQL